MAEAADNPVPSAATPLRDIATSIAPRPSVARPRGFRLLVLRQFLRPSAPPAIAFIDQSIFRRPDRPVRHGISFELTFLPEIVAWLIEQVGRPGLRAASGKPVRNPDWPALSWHSEQRLWPDGTETVEWFAEAEFPDEAVWAAFRKDWREQLDGQPERQLACSR